MLGRSDLEDRGAPPETEGTVMLEALDIVPDLGSDLGLWDIPLGMDLCNATRL